MPGTDPVLQLYQDLASIHGGLRAPDAAIVERAMRFIHDSPAPRLSGSLPVPTPNIAERVGILEDALREGIDGGQRAKAEIDKSLEELYLTSGLHHVRLEELESAMPDGKRTAEELARVLERSNKLLEELRLMPGRIEALEDKAGFDLEWQEAVDAQLNEIYGRLLEIEADPPKTDTQRAKPVRLTYYDVRGENLYSVYVQPGSFVTPPPRAVLDRVGRIEVS